MSAELAALEKQNRELKKANKELKVHNKFLEDRLEKWADKNFDLRQEQIKLEQKK
tara:strand:- start:571 stop:735 length:165 start_codon:yes stop_codon:yes gene_type:complete